MVIAPKNHFKQHSFVDRKVCLQNFINAVNDLGQKKFSVLVYYGVAGIGKTSLRACLKIELDLTIRIGLIHLNQKIVALNR